MNAADEPEQTRPNVAKAGHAEPGTGAGQPGGELSDEGEVGMTKPDEGIRPDRLTTENDGGSQG